MNGRITMAALLLAAAAAPAQADDNALAKLYALAEQRTKAMAASDGDTKAGGQARFGHYGPVETVRSAPLRSVMYGRRTPDGRLVTECHTEHLGPNHEPGHDARRPREQQ